MVSSLFLCSFCMYFVCVCVEFKRAGEAMLLEKDTQNWEDRYAQKTNGSDVNSSKKRWVLTLNLWWSHQSLVVNHASLDHSECKYIYISLFLAFHSINNFVDCLVIQIKPVTNITSLGLRCGFQRLTDPTANLHTHTHTQSSVYWAGLVGSNMITEGWFSSITLSPES